LYDATTNESIIKVDSNAYSSDVPNTSVDLSSPISINGHPYKLLELGWKPTMSVSDILYDFALVV
jgi:hypothetical protein